MFSNQEQNCDKISKNHTNYSYRAVVDYDVDRLGVEA